MSANEELPPQEIIDMVHFTWKRMRNSLASELRVHGYARAKAIPLQKSMDLSAIDDVMTTTRVYDLGFELQHVSPLFHGFPYVYRIMCFGIEVETGPCPEGYTPK